MNISALSWNIATEPKLYWELAPNPYTPRALEIISERFFGVNKADIIKAVILAEPEGKYDRKFKNLPVSQQKKLLHSEIMATTGIGKKLTEYSKIHQKDFDRLSDEFIFRDLSKFAFACDDLKEINNKYSQNQRMVFRLTIVNYIANRPRKKIPGNILLLWSLAAVSVILIFIAQKQIQSIGKSQIQGPRTLGINSRKVDTIVPLHLKIPSINIDAKIEQMDVTAGGEMESPTSTINAGWFSRGPVPGEQGSAVIAGHLDGSNGSVGIFSNLNKLKAGDLVYIEDSIGKTSTFIVRESRLYDPGFAEEVFRQSSEIHLNLVTCDGVWDGIKKSFTKRLVVFTDVVN